MKKWLFPLVLSACVGASPVTAQMLLKMQCDSYENMISKVITNGVYKERPLAKANTNKFHRNGERLEIEIWVNPESGNYSTLLIHRSDQRACLLDHGKDFTPLKESAQDPKKLDDPT